jgi:hypothetical protein
MSLNVKYLKVGFFTVNDGENIVAVVRAYGNLYFSFVDTDDPEDVIEVNIVRDSQYRCTYSELVHAKKRILNKKERVEIDRRSNAMLEMKDTDPLSYIFAAPCGDVCTVSAEDIDAILYHFKGI